MQDADEAWCSKRQEQTVCWLGKDATIVRYCHEDKTMPPFLSCLGRRLCISDSLNRRRLQARQ